MRMATTIVELQEFQPDNKSFSSYVDGVQLFFTAKDIEYNKKVAVLLVILITKSQPPILKIVGYLYTDTTDERMTE